MALGKSISVIIIDQLENQEGSFPLVSRINGPIKEMMRNSVEITVNGCWHVFTVCEQFTLFQHISSVYSQSVFGRSNRLDLHLSRTRLTEMRTVVLRMEH